MGMAKASVSHDACSPHTSLMSMRLKRMIRKRRWVINGVHRHILRVRRHILRVHLIDAYTYFEYIDAYSFDDLFVLPNHRFSVIFNNSDIDIDMLFQVSHVSVSLHRHRFSIISNKIDIDICTSHSTYVTVTHMTLLLAGNM